jgi:hypothetical protein
MQPNIIKDNNQVVGSITARWWFIALIPVVFFFSPPIVQKNGFALTDFQKWFETIGFIASNNFTGKLAAYSPFMNITAISMIVLVFLFRSKFSSFFSIYTAILMLFYGIAQNTSYTDKHGLGIITS